MNGSFVKNSVSDLSNCYYDISKTENKEHNSCHLILVQITNLLRLTVFAAKFGLYLRVNGLIHIGINQ